MEIQWYPGHMTKAKRAMTEDIRLIDIVLELVDARVPESSRNPDIDTLAAGRQRLILLNKADLADPKLTKAWEEVYVNRGFFVMSVDARKTGQTKAIQAKITEACAAKIERDKKRGIIGRPIRAMIVGIPNVGKSTFINSFAGKACTKTGNTPGITKGKQWIRLNKSVELLDTPGILWPKFEDPEVGYKLAMIGSIKDDILDRTDVTIHLLELLANQYPEVLADRYGISIAAGAEDEPSKEGGLPGQQGILPEEGGLPGQQGILPEEGDLSGQQNILPEENGLSGQQNILRPENELPREYGLSQESELSRGNIGAGLLMRIAEARNCRKKGNLLDPDRAAKLILDDFRSGRMGRITLDIPE